MASYMCMDTLKFLLFDVHKIQEVFALHAYRNYTEETAHMLLDATKDWADRDFYPYYREMDEKPVTYKEGKVFSHPILSKIFEEAGTNGFLGCYLDETDGGSQMPYSLANANNHIIEAANNHIPGYLGLTNGAAHLITSFGSDDLKKAYVPKMIKGKWGGTMALTEPHAGSSLSDLTTKARHIAEGIYAIEGQKIFISGGDHQGVENFIHLTLARIEGAPAGIKGISLFVVPKYLLQGGDLVYNNVETAGDFQKLGQRGYSTVHLVFGEKGVSKGFLVGQPHQGLKYMFQMMNGARIDVGMTAASIASAAFYHSLQYSKERIQGRKITSEGKKDIEDKPVAIIEHPDVKRMLFKQKAIVEGSLSLLIECSKWQDLSIHEKGKNQEKARLLLELLTPVAKTFPSEKGIESVSSGLQILGGYGYCMDFPLQQYYRDIRIMSIYEGTTGIQSLDLLGRKIIMENGKALFYLFEDIQNLIKESRKSSEPEKYYEALEKSTEDIQKAIAHVTSFARKGDYSRFLADATIFMEMFSIYVIGYQWLKMVTTLSKGITKESSEFHRAKVQTMKYFYKYEMPNISRCLTTILQEDQVTITSELDPFVL